MKKTFIFSVCFLLCSVLAAQEFSDMDSVKKDLEKSGTEMILSEIKFTGNKKTRESFLNEHFDDYEGRVLDEKLLSQIEADIKSLNLFSESDFALVTEQDNKAELQVKVKEKISFIPLPLVMYSSNTGWMFGAFIMDMNAFGQKDMFTTGGMWSQSTTMGLATYVHQPKKGVPGFSLFGNFSKSSPEFKTLDNDKYFSYDDYATNLRGSLLFRLNRYNSLSCGLGYHGLWLDGDYNLGDKIYDRQLGSASVSWGISDSSWNGVFLSSTGLSADTEVSYDNKNRCAAKLKLRSSVQQPVTQKLRFTFDAGGAIVLNGIFSDYAKEGDGAVTILVDKFATPKIAGGATGLEYAFFELNGIGTFSVYGNYQVVFAEDYDESLAFCQGFEFGTKIYLKELPFPALSLGCAYNATKSQFSFAGSFGVNF